MPLAFECLSLISSKLIIARRLRELGLRMDLTLADLWPILIRKISFMCMRLCRETRAERSSGEEA